MYSYESTKDPSVIDQYINMAGKFFISSSFDRSLISANNSVINFAKRVQDKIDFNELAQNDFSIRLANVPFGTKNIPMSISVKTLRRTLKNFAKNPDKFIK